MEGNLLISTTATTRQQPDFETLRFSSGMKRLLSEQPGANEFLSALDKLLSIVGGTAHEAQWLKASNALGVPEFRFSPQVGFPGASIRLSPTSSSGQRILGEEMGGPYFAPLLVRDEKRWDDAQKVRTAPVRGESALPNVGSRMFDKAVSFAQKLSELAAKEDRIKGLLGGLVDTSPVVEIFATVPRIGSNAAHNEFMIDFKLPDAAQDRHFAALMLCGDRLVYPLAMNNGASSWLIGLPRSASSTDRSLVEEQFSFTSREELDDTSLKIHGGARAHELVLVLLPYAPPSGGSTLEFIMREHLSSSAVSSGVIGSGAAIQNTWLGGAKKLMRPHNNPSAAIFHLHILEVDPTQDLTAVHTALSTKLDDRDIPPTPKFT